MSYVRLPIDRAFQAILDDAVAFLTSESGGQWVADKGSVEAWILEAFAREGERLLRHAGDMTDEAYSTFLTEDVDLPLLAGSAATTSSTWTLRTLAGHTITAGTLVAVGADQTLFSVVADVTVDPGLDTTDPGEVLLAAIANGTAANGIPPGAATLVSLDPTVLSIVTTATTAGGSDDETTDAHRTRGRGDMRLQTRIGIRVDELPVQARRVAGVHRALAIKGYDASTSTPDQPGHATVVSVDIAGAALDAQTKLELEAELTASGKRVLNGTIHVIDPTPVAVAVHFDAVAKSDADPAVVKPAVIAVLTAELDPATHGGGAEDPPVWDDDTVIRHDRLVQLVRNTPGVDYLNELTINGVEDNVDLAAGGVIGPLPDASITGDVSAP